ncbi:hypothetical protein EAO74_05550 [Streptomyces sp. gb1(2016)]|uniref:Uncharacterized protein n=1 Tax=Streptomyces sp. gb1(2016) TaxID=1828321 RepID=A0A652L9P1_9ACTN|nr:hypothetical protein EAO74_05550 [Streptomyces sp. gb1(2016)]
MGSTPELFPRQVTVPAPSDSSFRPTTHLGNSPCGPRHSPRQVSPAAHTGTHQQALRGNRESRAIKNDASVMIKVERPDKDEPESPRALVRHVGTP